MKRLISLILVIFAALCLTTCAESIPEPEPDYLYIMVCSAAAGDVSRGREAEQLRDMSTESTLDGYVHVSFDDLYLLSRFLYFRYGSYRCSDELRLCSGEVILNRVASPEYPDTLEGVIFQSGQTDPVDRAAFDECLVPSRACVSVALRLLMGERMLEPSVVLQTDYPAKDVYAMFCDRLLGNTYFYKSENLELYSGSSAG